MNLTRFIGIPYTVKGRTMSGVDCWGLVRVFYKDVLDFDVPSYSDDYKGPADRASVSETIEANLVNWQRVDSPAFGDLLVFNILGLPLHTGVYIGNNDFIHAFQNTNSCIERLNSITWKRRLAGIYRWAKK